MILVTMLFNIFNRITPLDLAPPGLSVGVPLEKNGALLLLRIAGRKEIFSTGFLDLSNSLILIN